MQSFEIIGGKKLKGEIKKLKKNHFSYFIYKR